ncbi:DUF1559 family PulG-like putative transporter [Blastopirellula marina]|uniref:DUF1559 domain-containing protein n=1 Tax=Blastopirellula marina DSM 3645 TaxID=314230 RepID=A3ZXZ4_9BACT|nr:DUF1559 domain-containing protein [Blastopirellula marina]EAQ78705.1 hypothetical protein DSM3645_07930 [Blastopirellula marina DSM 3645]
MTSYLKAILVGFLTATMAFSPQWALMAQEAATVEKGSLGLEYVPDNAVGVGFLRAEPLLTSSVVKNYPVEVAQAFGAKYLGFDPMRITSILLIATLPTPENPTPDVVAVVKTSETLQGETFFANIGELVEEMADQETVNEVFAGLKGKAFFTEAYPLDYLAAHQLDEHTFLLGSLTAVAAVVTNGPHAQLTQPAQMLADAGDDADVVLMLNMAPVRDQINGIIAQQEIPFPFAVYKQIPDSTKSITLSGHFTNKMALTLKIDAVDKEAAQKLEYMAGFTMEMAKAAMLGEAQKLADSKDEIEAAMGQYQTRMAESMLKLLQPKRDGDALVIRFEQSEDKIAATNVAIVGVLVALLLPAVQSARTAARRAASANNLKQIALAMHMFHDTYRTFPPQAITDKEGKKLLSWRVMILPFIEQHALYEQFHLDEPWDSEHNRKLIPRMPAIYNNPNSTTPEGYANYVGSLGKGMFFEQPTAPPEGQPFAPGLSFRNFTDGTSNTLMCVETNEDAAVIWTQPSDLEVDLMNVWKNLGKAQLGGFNAAYCDGSVRFINMDTPAKTLQLLFQRNDGQVIPQ